MRLSDLGDSMSEASDLSRPGSTVPASSPPRAEQAVAETVSATRPSLLAVPDKKRRVSYALATNDEVAVPKRVAYSLNVAS